MSDLLQEINTEVNDISILSEQLQHKVKLLGETYEELTVQMICETAETVLAHIILRIENNKLDDVDKISDTLAGFEVLTDENNRGAVNVSQSRFKIIVKKAGDSVKVDNIVQRIGKHPSVASIHGNIKDTVVAASKGDDTAAKQLNQKVRQMRMNYEKIQREFDGE